jgi:ATP-grasp domain, R2K clade family 3
MLRDAGACHQIENHSRSIAMLFVLCRDSLEPTRPDRSFQSEVAAIERLGLTYVLVDHDALVRGDDAERVIRRVPEQAEPITAVYRGWMMTPPQYRLVFEALAGRNIRLINDLAQYQHCHYLPECYPIIEGLTPRSVWLTGDLSIDRIMDVLATLGDRPVIVKDFVKSRKHEWTDACFIPSAADRADVERVVGNFLELQGDDLNEGLVFREFVEFRPIGVHPKSSMPLTEEYRIFWMDAQPVFGSPYWEGGKYCMTYPPLELFAEIAAAVRSRFFTMDVARRTDGDWMIVELGDGQVSGLPREDDAGPFYELLTRK